MVCGGWWGHKQDQHVGPTERFPDAWRVQRCQCGRRETPRRKSDGVGTSTYGAHPRPDEPPRSGVGEPRRPRPGIDGSGAEVGEYEPPRNAIHQESGAGNLQSVNEDEANELILALGSPAVVAAWKRTKDDREKRRQRNAELQAEFDSLSIDEVRDRAADALSSATDLLRTAPINEELERHGWTPEFARGMAQECDRLRVMVEHGTYPAEWGGYGLGRSMQEEIDPTTTDDLTMAVLHATSYLKAMSARG